MIILNVNELIVVWKSNKIVAKRGWPFTGDGRFDGKKAAVWLDVEFKPMPMTSINRKTRPHTTRQAEGEVDD
jgi:hypothetical protein